EAVRRPDARAPAGLPAGGLPAALQGRRRDLGERGRPVAMDAPVRPQAQPARGAGGRVPGGRRRPASEEAPRRAVDDRALGGIGRLEHPRLLVRRRDMRLTSLLAILVALPALAGAAPLEVRILSRVEGTT